MNKHLDTHEKIRLNFLETEITYQSSMVTECLERIGDYQSEKEAIERAGFQRATFFEKALFRLGILWLYESVKFVFFTKLDRKT